MTWPRLKIFAVTLILACAGGNFHTDVCKSPQVARMPAKLNVCTVTYTVFIQQHPASSETSVADKLAVIDARLRELAIGDDTESSKMFETILAPFNGKNGALGEKYSDSGLRGRGSIGFLEEKGKLTSTILKVTDVDVSSLVSGSSAGFKIATTWEDGPGFPYGQSRWLLEC